MKGIIILIVFSIPLFIYATKGEVVFEKRDHFVVDTGASYTVLQWEGGCTLSEGDCIDGNLNSSGFKEIYNLSCHGETKVYVQATALSKDDVMERIFELED